MTVLDVWEEIFDRAPVPDWLVRFDEAPTPALDDFLSGRFFHGHLNVAEPEDLMIAWIRMLGDQGDFVGRLDRELYAWVERSWGVVPKRRPWRWADTWQCVANIAGPLDEELPLTVETLRERFWEARDALGPFSTGSSRDPLGRYYWAMARHQKDRSLEKFWWSMCDLDDGVPFYHADYAVEGVTGLPPSPEQESGGFREDVVLAVLRVGRALERLKRGRRLNDQQVITAFRLAAGSAFSAFPFFDRWSEVLVPRGRDLPEWIRRELLDRVHGLDQMIGRSRGPRIQEKNWKKPTDLLVTQLKRGSPQARIEIGKFLDEARSYAEGTGNSVPLNRALCRFASLISSTDAEQAVTWAEEAVLWEPWDAYSSTTLTKALLRARRLDEALATAWQSVDRFPHNPVARNGLGEVLKAQQRLDAAEEIYRETVERFPKDVVARTGLGEVLKAQQRLDDAEEVYRETVERFPKDVVARNGLGDVLKAQKRLDDAEEVYRETVERFPNNVVARNGLGEVLKAQKRLDDAEEVYRETVERFPNNDVARNGLGDVLKAQKRLDDAEEVYRETVERFPKDVVARTGLGEVLKAQQRLDDAEEVYRETVERFPNNTYAKTGLESVLRVKGEAEDFAEEVTADSEDPAAVVAPAERVSDEPTAPSLAAAAADIREALPGPDARKDVRTRLARLHRTSARRAEKAGRGPSPDSLRDRAHKLLDDVLTERSNDSRALTEKGLLLVDSGASEAARELLAEHAERLPAATLLWSSLARAVREEARAGERRLAPETEEDVLAAPRQLQEIDRAYEPLVRLQEGRAYLCLTDGNRRLEGAARAFERLRKWVASQDPERTREFEPWFGAEMHRHVFSGVDIEQKVTLSHVDVIASSLDENARFVDTLEEDFVLRFS